MACLRCDHARHKLCARRPGHLHRRESADEFPIAVDDYLGLADLGIVVDQPGRVFVQADAAVRRGVVRDEGIVVESDAAFGVEPCYEADFWAALHRVTERLDVHRAFGGAVGIYAATFRGLVAIVVAEAAAGGAVVLGARVKAGVGS